MCVAYHQAAKLSNMVEVMFRDYEHERLVHLKIGLSSNLLKRFWVKWTSRETTTILLFKKLKFPNPVGNTSSVYVKNKINYAICLHLSMPSHLKVSLNCRLYAPSKLSEMNKEQILRKPPLPLHINVDTCWHSSISFLWHTILGNQLLWKMFGKSSGRVRCFSCISQKIEEVYSS